MYKDSWLPKHYNYKMYVATLFCIQLSLTFLLEIQGMKKSTIINIKENIIDRIAGSPYVTKIPLHHDHLDISVIIATIPIEGSCIKLHMYMHQELISYS